MKKFLALTLAASLIILSGCSQNSDEKDGDASTQISENPADLNTVASTENDITESEITAAPATSSEYTTSPLPSADVSAEELREYMINNSLMTTGDTARMINVIKKAQAGEDITVGFIGGSITEGISAGDSLCYAKLTHNALCGMFPDANIDYVNAGLSGTPSVLGVVRAERDLFGDKQPDIIFIEFAVNDGGGGRALRSADDKRGKRSEPGY